VLSEDVCVCVCLCVHSERASIQMLILLVSASYIARSLKKEIEN
jgi:hypothetical protein